jgi:hypothetical protein
LVSQGSNIRLEYHYLAGLSPARLAPSMRKKVSFGLP